jgi:hypothetical protein
MQKSLNDSEIFEYIKKNVLFRVGNFDFLRQMEVTPAMSPFSAQVVDFLDAFSKKLLHIKGANLYPDIVTLGFWCRRASVESMKKEHESDRIRVGRGISFHIAPSNVAVNFAYSMLASLFAGNINIVRLPSKHFDQVDIIVDSLNQVLDEFTEMKPYVMLVQYERDKKINDFFSELCDIRVIWGGDNTIAALRESKIRPRTKEICFADRYSICVIDADCYLENKKYDETANGFYNDTYLNDQNACTSPKLIVWMGKRVEEAQDVFWESLAKIVKDKYSIGPVQIIDKLDAALQYAAMCDTDVAPKYTTYDASNKINRVQIEKVASDLLEVKQNSGLFFEIKTNDLKDILPVCVSKLQTIASVNVPKEVLTDFFLNNCPRGIDRIVPVGKTLDFSLIWDGYDLINEMTRQVVIDV